MTASLLASAAFLLLFLPYAAAQSSQPGAENKPAPETAVNIPDLNLSRFLHDVTGVPQENPIRIADLNALSGTLEAKNLNIADAEGIQYCTGIEKLDLSGNLLVSMPDLSGMEKLKTLDLSQNMFSSVPEGVLKAIKLASLSMNGNDITELPPELAGLKHLTALSISGNQLSAFPDVLLGLELETLNISDNPVGSLPDNISDMAALKSLNAAECGLKALPDKFFGMTKLRKLNLSYNQFSALPRDIANFDSLESLNISGNSLTSLPPEISKLHKLKVLSANDNLLESLPDKIGDLRLEELYANKNNITALPSSLAEIKSLKKLDLRLNRLTRLPSGLDEINFETFDVEWNFLDVSEDSPLRKMMEGIKAKEACLFMRQLTPIRNLIAASHPDSITLSWDPCADGSDGSSIWSVSKYTVFAVNGDKLQTVAEVAPPEASFSVPALQPASIYAYKVSVEYEINDPPEAFEGVTRHYAGIEVRTADADAPSMPSQSPTIFLPLTSPPAVSIPVEDGTAFPVADTEAESVWLYVFIAAAALFGIGAISLTVVFLLRKKR